VTARVIVLNGGSSSGKSGIARCLQAILPDPWLAFGTDTLVEAMPASMRSGVPAAVEKRAWHAAGAVGRRPVRERGRRWP
jgi:chloramphenicol 3-O-phosphotransferase